MNSQPGPLRSLAHDQGVCPYRTHSLTRSLARSLAYSLTLSFFPARKPLSIPFYEALALLDGDDDKVSYALSQMADYDFENVRHVEAFCTGICRRVNKHGTSGVNLGVLGEEMKETLERLIAEGKFAREDLDFRVVSSLEKLSESDRKLAVQRYEEKLDDTINSKQGFLMGIVNRMAYHHGGASRGGHQYNGHPRGGKRHGGRGGYRGGGGGGGGDRDHKRTDRRHSGDQRRERSIFDS